MNSLVILLAAIAVFAVAYIFYGGFLAKKWGIDKMGKTPANRLRDNMDYVPTDARVLFGHHFSSIAGAGPITGPILAAVFGWLPVYLWILAGSVFFGGVHDFGALVASIDNDGKSIGEIIKSSISKKMQTIFNLYAWVTITLVIAAFADICAKTFAWSPESTSLVGAQAGTASIIFILLALAFGFARNKLSAPLGLSTILGVLCVMAAIVFGYYCPVIKLSVNGWRIVLIVYIILASVMPVWMLLQPRDYLCSFLLYAMMAGAIIGVFVKRPAVNMKAFTGWSNASGTMFPVLFVTVACGAISGFHSLISSGTTSKQINKAKPDSQVIGYGAMLVEGLLAVVTLIAICYLSSDGVHALDGAKLGTPAATFAKGVAQFMASFGIPFEAGQVFVTLSYSAFALTSLDTATRIGRYLLQELSGDLPKGNAVRKIGSNMYAATIVTIAISVVFLLAGYAKVWPIFGSANQLLAALALLAISAWIGKKYGVRSMETAIPMMFMFVVTLTSLALMIVKNFKAGGFKPLGVIAAVLFVLAILQLVEAVRQRAWGGKK